VENIALIVAFTQNVIMNHVYCILQKRVCSNVSERGLSLLRPYGVILVYVFWVNQKKYLLVEIIFFLILVF